jgi:hypothetical protein
MSRFKVVVTSPIGRDVYLAANPYDSLGVSPEEISLDVGTHTLQTIQRDGGRLYADYEGTVKALPGGKTHIGIELEKVSPARDVGRA